MSELRAKLSPRESAWLGCLKRAQRKEITQKEAASVMGVSTRWVRKLLQRMKTEGDHVVIHGLRGKPSNRRVKDNVRRQVVDLLKAEYRDLGPTLAAAYLHEQKGIVLSKETLRQWMIQEGLWSARNGNRRVSVSSWSPRRERAGELVHWYLAEGEWLRDGASDVRCLMVILGDATSRAVARFCPEDAPGERIAVLQEYLKKFGRPREFRFGAARLAADGHTILLSEDVARPGAQLQRILKRLEIAWSSVVPPYPSGRVEHFLGAASKWLSSRMPGAGIRSAAAANRYLSNIWLPNWNRRFSVPPPSGEDSHRPLTEDVNTVIDGL